MHNSPHPPAASVSQLLFPHLTPTDRLAVLDEKWLEKSSTTLAKQLHISQGDAWYYLSLAVDALNNQRANDGGPADGIEQSRSYVYVTARRRAVADLYTKNSKVAARLLGTAVEAVQDSSASACPLEATLQRDRAEEVQRALDKLGDDERTVLCLYYIEEQTANEIAHELGRPIQEIKALILRAKRALSGHLSATTQHRVHVAKARARMKRASMRQAEEGQLPS